MKKQQHSRGSVLRSKWGRKFGQQIAEKPPVKQEDEPDVTTTSIHPMDTLLVGQLQTILDGEKALRARYSALGPAANSPEVRMAFAKELHELKDRTDRLSRFLNAMDYYGSRESAPMVSPASA